MTVTHVRPVFLLMAALLLAGCSSAPTTPSGQAAATPAVTSVPSAPRGAASPAPASTVAATKLAPHLDAGSPVSRERSVFFEFDQYALDAGDKALVELHGKYLIANPRLSVKIEGNTDERGSSEYNLALGQRRAQAVLSALKLYGVKPSQMEALSWGEERPKSAGHDEAAWAQNRRADVNYVK